MYYVLLLLRMGLIPDFRFEYEEKAQVVSTICVFSFIYFTPTLP